VEIVGKYPIDINWGMPSNPGSQWVHHLGGGNSNIFGIFTPKIGEGFQFDEHIF